MSRKAARPPTTWVEGISLLTGRRSREVDFWIITAAEYDLAPSLPARYAFVVRLRLGDGGEPGPEIRAITPDIWDQLAQGEKGERWLAFAGEGAAVWLRLNIREGRTVATGMLVETLEPLSVAQLRSIPFGRLLNLAAQYADNALRFALPADQLDRSPSPALPTAAKKYPGRRGHSVEDLKKVADVCVEARKTHPSAPMKETARLLAYSVAQARRLVRRAQAEGLIDSKEE